MVTYFDLIPRDITEIILQNVNESLDLYNLYESKILNEVLLDENYWMMRIKSYCKMVDVKQSIPSNLLDFNGSRFEIILMNYFTIINAYDYVTYIIKDHEGNVDFRNKLIVSGDIIEGDPDEYEEHITWAYELCITNFKLFRLDLIKSPDKDMINDIISTVTKNINLYSRRFGRISSIQITFGSKNTYRFKITDTDNHSIKYYVHEYDAINMIMHLRCNNAPEIEPF